MSLVDHPSHYNRGGPIEADGAAQFEVIKLIEDMGWGYGFCMGNALKYLLRAPYKGAETQDIDKARWYLARAATMPGHTRPMASRRLDVRDALAAWGLLDEGATLDAQAGPLAHAIAQIAQGDPTAALAALDGMAGG